MIAPNKSTLLKKNWLFILAILISVLRLLPIHDSSPLVRGITVTFGMQVVWIFASADQGIRFVRRALGRRGSGYVLAITAVIIFSGAAGILHYENMSTEPGHIQTYQSAIWWTAMQLTNIGSSYAIKTDGGRIIGLIISIYSAGAFGYLTALFATLLLDREIIAPKVESTTHKEIQDLTSEISNLCNLVRDLTKSKTGIQKE